MSLIALMAAAVGPAVEIVVDAKAYDLSFARAQTFEQDPAIQAWRNERLYPAALGSMRALLKTCAAEAGPPQITVVLAYDPDVSEPRVLLREASKRGACVGRGLAGLPFPAPPKPDFAEEIRFEF